MQLERGDKSFLILYDIACVLEKHLKVGNTPSRSNALLTMLLQNCGKNEIFRDTTLGIPIFHVYGHCASCQVCIYIN